MPREYDLTALKPFDYEGRSVVAGDSLRTGILGFIQLVGTGKAKLERTSEPASVPLIAKTPKPAKRKPGRPKKSETVCKSSA